MYGFLIAFAIGATAQAHDLAIGHFEITQGLQRGTNDIPLVLGKPTVVRVFPKVEGEAGPVADVSARLHAVRDCAELPGSPIEPDNGPISVGATFDRINPDHSLNFTLDPDWYTHDTELWAELVLPEGVTDPNSANNRFPAGENVFHARYEDRRGYNIRFVRVRFTHPAWMGDPVPRPHVADQTSCDWMRMIFPVDPTEMPYEVWSPEEITFGAGNASGNLDGNALITELNTLYAANPLKPDKLYGWTPELSFPSNGLSDPFWAGGQNLVAFGNDTEGTGPFESRFRRTFAHEIGHNTDNNGLFHTDRRLQNDEFGFDVMNVDPFGRTVMRRYPPGDPEGGLNLFDVMRGGEVEAHAWITPPHYDHLFRALAPSDVDTSDAPPAVEVTATNTPDVADAAQPADAAPPANPAADEPGRPDDLLVVRGEVGREGGGRFFPFYRIPATAENLSLTEDLPKEGSHEIRFLGEGDQVLFRIAWTPDFRGDDTQDPLKSRSFSWFLRPIEGVRQVVLSSGETVLDTLRVRPEKPEVDDIQQEERNAGDTNAPGATPSMHIAWDAAPGGPETGAPGDENVELQHQVFFSNDGGESWRLVATGLKSPEADVNLAGLPGGPECRFQVRTTDGFNVTSMTGPAFDLETKAPRVSILAPRSDRTYRQGAGVLLVGRGEDPEGGVVPDERLSWSSDQQGELGAGSQLVVRNLEPGTHKITLKATDSEGNQSKPASLTVVVKPR